MRTEQEGVVAEPVEKQLVEYELRTHVDIRIKPSLEKYLRDLGGGEVSEGVIIVAKFYQDAQQRDK